MIEFFFVYGTLKKGYSNNELLKTSQFLGKAITLENYKLYTCGFPMALYSPDDLPVLGELYRVESENVIKNLDRLEGNGIFYSRKQIKVKLLDFFDQVLTAWIYEIPDTKFGYSGFCDINKDYNAWEWKR